VAVRSRRGRSANCCAQNACFNLPLDGHERAFLNQLQRKPTNKSNYVR
jgi:hypothetical protein